MPQLSLISFYHLIREKITPRGDGNPTTCYIIKIMFFIIREKITPRGDGNF